MSEQVVYDEDSMDLLKGCKRVRMRPASMLGSSGLAGARHGFTEIYGNALDEISSGFGNKLVVKYFMDGSLAVRDYGRGVPLGWSKKNNTWSWHLVYNELYGGGKISDSQKLLSKVFDWKNFNPKLYNYLYSVGLYGLGAASTQYTSDFFTVKSYREGVCSTVHFEDGYPVFDGKKVDMFDNALTDLTPYEPLKEETDEPNGTYIHWRPSNEVFSNVDIGGDWLLKICQDIVNIAHIDLHFEDETTDTVLDFKAGDLGSLLAEKCGSHLLKDDLGNNQVIFCDGFTHGTTATEGKQVIYVAEASIAIGICDSHSVNSCYHNSVYMNMGAQYDGILLAVRDFFNARSSERGIKLEQGDYSDILSFVVSTYSNVASFRGTSKEGIDDVFTMDLVHDTILKKLNTEYGKGNPYLVNVVDSAVDTATIRLQQKSAYEASKKLAKIGKKKVSSKFHTCIEYIHGDYRRTELWIAEGDSAQGSVDLARNSDFQASLAIRGKCLNVLKKNLDRILANKEISDIFALLGTGMDIGKELFDISKLKFNKIIFATDADEDGFQIRVLLFLIFYKLAPELIKKGHVYIAETPRFEVSFSDGRRLYARDDKTKDEILEQNKGIPCEVKRFKGLGEAPSEIIAETTVNVETRNLVPIDFDFDSQFEVDLIDALFGKDKYHQRKKILIDAFGIESEEMLDDEFLATMGMEDDSDDIEDETEDDEEM